MMEGQFLTVDEVAELLRVKKSWLYERTRLNQIPHRKLGKYLLFLEEEVLEWVERFKRDGKGKRIVF
jgi:excisionase family DNA binding protein